MAQKKTKRVSPTLPVFSADKLSGVGKQSVVRSTNILPLDVATGIMGWRSSMFVEIFGPESSGKTLIALLSAIAAQKLYGERSLLIDGEFVWDPQDAKKMSYQVEWFRKLGGDPSMLDIYWPEYSEKTYSDIIETFLPSNNYAYIIIDSWKAMTPKAKLDAVVGDRSAGAFGAAAMINNEFISQALPILFHKTNTTFLVVNHEYIDPNVKWGDPRTSPGGRALKFYAKQRIQTTAPGDKSEERAIIKGGFKKNKIKDPYRVFEFPINFQTGFDETDLLCRLGYENGIITGGAGGTYYFNDVKYAGGKIKLVETFKNDPVAFQLLKNAVLNVYKPELMDGVI